MRHDLRFALVRDGLERPSVAAWSGVVAVEHPNQPMQGHLSLGGAPGCGAGWARGQGKWGRLVGMLVRGLGVPCGTPCHPLERPSAFPPSSRSCREVAVQWATRERGSPSVRWGAAPGALDRSAAGHSVTYRREELCGPPANTTGWLDPGWLHAAVMRQLPPLTRIYYQYGDEVRG